MLASSLLLLGLVVPGDPGVPFKPFAPPALEEARGQGRLAAVLVSRRACPRCRSLMAASLEDESVAAVLSGRYVPVELDADERPDVARGLADALLLLPEPRPAPDPGLPFLVLTTADLRVVDGTSLAREGRALGPAVLAFLVRHADDWDENKGTLEARAGLVLAALREAQSARPPAPLTFSLLARPVAGLREAFDRRHGGFGVAPRRIPHGALRLLFEEYERTGDASARDMACATLDAILQGGLRDPRGGFFREATAEDWSLPVKERTLADNALLLAALVSAHEATGRDTYAEGAGHIAGFLRRSLADPDGGFLNALSDGSQGEERDPRVFAFANGLALSGLARSGKGLGRREDLALAEQAAERVLGRVGPASRLVRFTEGTLAGGPALLEDYAFLAAGFLDLAAATGQLRWRDEARSLLDHALTAFAAADGGFFASTEDGAPRPARLRDAYDGLLPSANAVLISALHRLGRDTGENLYTELARRCASAFASDLLRAPSGLATLAAAVGELLGPAPSGAGTKEAALASRATKGAVSFEAVVRPDRVGPGGRAELSVTMSVAASVFVVAHDPFAGGSRPRDAADLAAFSVAFPGSTVRLGAPRHSPGQPVVLPGSDVPVRGLSGNSTLRVPFTVPSEAVDGDRRLRVRIVFQACGQSRGCDVPDNVLLEAPYTVAAPAGTPSVPQ